MRRERLARQRIERGRWRVSDVVDGDTVRVRRSDGSASETVRLIGIDTPETRKPGVGIECGGPEATAGMLAASFSAPIDSDGDRVLDLEGGSGVVVALRTDSRESLRDRFGRVLAYIDAVDDLAPNAGGAPYDLGRVQVAAGHSTAYRYEGRRFRRYATYRRAETAARGASRGVWGACGGNFHSEQ